MPDWQPIETAPFLTVILVRNPYMDGPVRATRGYATEIGVHPNLTYCTSVYTPQEFFPMLAGQLVCPTEWAPFEEPRHAD